MAAVQSSSTDRLLYAGLCVSQFLTFASYAVVSAGAALLQKKANTLALFDGLDAADLQSTRSVYSEVFQDTGYIIPYPQRPKYQFQYQWWIIELEFFVFCLTLACTVFPRSVLPRLRPVALTFIASALVLVMDNVNALFYLLRSDLAKTVFDEYRIATAQAGLIMVGISNFLTIIFLGSYRPFEVVQHVDAFANIETGKATPQ